MIDPQIDRNGNALEKSNNTNASKQIKELMSELILQDVWRVRNPDTKRFSWYRVTKQNGKQVIQASRIDYAIISASLMKKVHNCMYINGIKSDHSAFFLGIEVETVNRGKGFWKLNTTLLKDCEFVKAMNSEISQLSANYKHMKPTEKWEIMKKKN